jgi:hypothetical protein
MHLRILAFAAAFAAAPIAAPAAPPAPIEVMVVSTFHMANPNYDLHNTRVPDVLTPDRQAQIAAVVDGLLRFRPTKVAVEWRASSVIDRYPKYLAGTLAPSRNEVVQLGFRLAHLAGDKPVFGIDSEGDFPYGPVRAWADAHGRGGELDAAGAETDRSNRETERLLAGPGIGAALRDLNTSAHVLADQGWYERLFNYGESDDQPGAQLMGAWAQRNYLICAKLVQLAKPGDRVVVIFGYGHGFLLRRCVSDQPGMKLVEANAYLPR